MTTTAEHTDLDRIRFFIDGEWVEPRGSETHRALEAATGEPLGTAALATDADIDAAVKAARRALDSGPWGRTTAAERAEVMHRFAAALAARADATSALVSRENGMPIGLSTAFNGAAPAGLLQMYAELIKAIPLEEVRPSQPCCLPAGADRHHRGQLLPPGPRLTLRRDERQRHRPRTRPRGPQQLPRIQVDLRQRQPAAQLTPQPARVGTHPARAGRPSRPP